LFSTTTNTLCNFYIFPTFMPCDRNAWKIHGAFKLNFVEFIRRASERYSRKKNMKLINPQFISRTSNFVISVFSKRSVESWNVCTCHAVDLWIRVPWRWLRTSVLNSKVSHNVESVSGILWMFRFDHRSLSLNNTHTYDLVIKKNKI
jgi:hypothetical protein